MTDAAGSLARPGDAWVIPGLTRERFFAGLLVLGCLNGFMDRALASIAADGLANALFDTFGISVVVMAACAVALHLLVRAPSRNAVSKTDLWLGLAAAMLFVVPVGVFSWFAVAALSTYLIATSLPGGQVRRACFILLSVTVAMQWSRLLFDFFAQPILNADAIMVAAIVGTHRVGNMVQFSDLSDFFQIWPACSSLHNVSLALVCWVTFTNGVGHSWSKRDLAWCGLVCFAMVAVNVARISLIGLHPDQFDLLHGPIGASIASVVALGLMVGVSILGVRRELFVGA